MGCSGCRHAFESANRIVCAYIEQGFSKLAVLDGKTGELEKIESPFTRIEGVRAGLDKPFSLRLRRPKRRA